jgi:hypothetical protein
MGYEYIYAVEYRNGMVTVEVRSNEKGKEKWKKIVRLWASSFMTMPGEEAENKQ